MNLMKAFREGQRQATKYPTANRWQFLVDGRPVTVIARSFPDADSKARTLADRRDEVRGTESPVGRSVELIRAWHQPKK